MIQDDRPRVAVLTRRFGVSFGGAERYAVEMVRELSSAFQIHVFAQEFDAESEGFVTIRVPVITQKPRWINQFWFALYTWWRCRSNFDIVHSHEMTWIGNVQTVHVVPFQIGVFGDLQPPMRWLKALGIILSPRLMMYWTLEHFRLKRKDGRRLIAVSASLQSMLSRQCRQYLPQVDLIEPGVSVPAMDQGELANRLALGLPAEILLGLFIANDYKKKGFIKLLESLHQLPDMHLVAISNQNSIKEMAALATKAGLADRIHFRLQTKKLSNYYRTANLFLHPTLEDSYGMVVLEAMAHGLPVVVSGPKHCGIAADLSQAHHALILDDPTQAHQITRAALAIVNDQKLREHLIDTGLKFVASRSWALKATELSRIYEEVCGASPCVVSNDNSSPL